MKKLILKLMVIAIAVGLIGFIGCKGLTAKSSSQAKEEKMADQKDLGPVVVMATPNVLMSKTSKVIIMGTGFKKKQDVNILFAGDDGVESDIGYALKPAPKSDNTGTWGTNWSAGDYVSKKLIKGGAYTLTVTDDGYNIITKAPVYFQKAKKKK
ncbi:MAG: hypothetical protein ABH858_06225 [Candidatus Omnitrophota bacterium]